MEKDNLIKLTFSSPRINFERLVNESATDLKAKSIDRFMTIKADLMRDVTTQPDQKESLTKLSIMIKTDNFLGIKDILASSQIDNKRVEIIIYRVAFLHEVINRDENFNFLSN